MRLQVDIYPSQQLALLLTAGHGAALIAVLFAFSASAVMMLSPVLLFSLAYFLLRDAWLRLPDSCTGLQRGPEGYALVRRDGLRLPCTLLGGSVVTPWLTVLTLLPQGARLARSVILLPGSVESESYRQLRVWLRWGERVDGETAADVPVHAGQTTQEDIAG